MPDDGDGDGDGDDDRLSRDAGADETVRMALGTDDRGGGWWCK
jgi:hypothetical protein